MEEELEELTRLVEAGQTLSQEQVTRLGEIRESADVSEEQIQVVDKLLESVKPAPEPKPKAPPKVKEEHITIQAHGGGQFVQLLEVEKTGKEAEFLVVEAGASKNAYYYDKKILENAAPLLNGVYAFVDHTNEQEQAVRPERSARDKVGRWTESRYGQATINGEIKEGIIAKLKVIAPWLRDVLRESVEMGEPDFLGVSIDALGKSNVGTKGGKKVRIVESIRKIYSADIVTMPSAGGHLMRLVASDDSERRPGVPDLDTEEPIRLTAQQLADIVKEQVSQVLKEAQNPLAQTVKETGEELARFREVQRVTSNKERFEAALGAAEGLSDAGKQRLRNSFSEAAGRRDLEDTEILESIKEAVGYEAALVQSSIGTPWGGSRARVGSASHDKYYLALQGMFAQEDVKDEDGKAVPRFQSIKEAYCRWTGRDPFEVDPFEIQSEFGCKYDSAKDHKRIKESVSTATWGQVYADVLYLMLIKWYRTSPVYNKWRMLVSDIENVPDFQTRHWSRIGGYSDLSTVAETQTYPMLVSPDDEEVTYAVQKRGGLDDITFEAIANDRVGAIRRIPIGMARAAVRTLFKFVLNMATTTNPVMDYDSTTLYHTNHGNTSTTALSLTGLQTVTTGMRQQTAFAETQEILGERNRPKILIVPTQLEFVAQRLVNPSDAYLAAIANPSTEQSLDPQAFKGQMDYLVYDALTSSTGWYAVADPAEVETMVMGFLNGKEDPELFVQDQPNVGANFTADKTTYKVRHIYGGDVVDHRSFFRGNT